MLESHGLSNKVLACTMDNASSNDTQMAALGNMSNLIDLDHRIRCFNHTIQLSAKALLQPFNTPTTEDRFEDEDDVDNNDDELDVQATGNVQDDDGLEEDDDDDDDDDSHGLDNGGDSDDPLASMDKAEKEALLADTQDVRSTLSKVCIHRLLTFHVLTSLI
jgi:hypothetical protein